MIGNSLIKTPYSEITATLEKLANGGVCEEDFALIRRYYAFCNEVAETIKRLRGLIEKAMGDGIKNIEEALMAVDQIVDVEVLVDIANKSKCLDAQLRAVSRIKREDTHLYDIARCHPVAEVVTAAVKRIDSWSTVWGLVCCINADWRQRIFDNDYKDRFSERHS